MDNQTPLYQENSFAYIYRFIESFILKEVPEIKSVDLFFDQYNNPDIDPKAPPRLLVEILPIDILNGFKGLYEAEVSVNLHIGIEIFNTFFSDSELKNNNLYYLNLLETIYTKLSMLSSYKLPTEEQNNNFLIHNVEMINMELATNPESLKVSKLGFRFVFENRVNYKQAISDNIISYSTAINL